MSKTFKDVSNTLQNFTFIGATVFEIAVGSARPPPLVKGVGTKGLGKEGLKPQRGVKNTPTRPNRIKGYN